MLFSAVYLSLHSKQVDFIAQIAADAANPIANQLQISRTREDVINAAGSRYAPSAPLATINELLARNERFAFFVGKPCDAAALRAYLRDNPQYKTWCLYSVIHVRGYSQPKRHRGCY